MSRKRRESLQRAITRCRHYCTYLTRRVWHEVWEDDVFDRAAILSFYFLLSLFPLLIFLTALLGFIASGGDIRQDLLNYFSRLMPRSAFSLVRATLQEITEGAGGGKLSIGILVTIWVSSSGMAAIIDGLNKAYDVKEARPWWKARIVAIALTFFLAVLSILALVIVLHGARLGELLATSAGLGEGFRFVWTFVQWPLVVAFVLLAFFLIYRYAPNIPRQKWQHILPGAFVGLILWLLVSFGFRFYLRYFNTYSKVYGSLGAVIILMMWFYMSGAAILIGGETNSEISNAAEGAHGPDRMHLAGAPCDDGDIGHTDPSESRGV